jgi:RND family efflux transporter MFP subunit
MKTFKSRTRTRTVALLVAAALFVWIAWSLQSTVRQTLMPEPPSPAAPVAVAVEILKPGPLEVVRSWRGSIDVDERAVLSTQITAEVVELPFREGALVEQGDVVYRLDDAELQAELARLDAVIERLAGELETARRELSRQRDLYARQLSPEKALDDASQRADSLAAQMREADASRNLLATRLAYATTRAPFSGRIQRLHLQRGELARAGSPVLELVAEGGLKAVARVAQNDIRHVREGLPVTLTVPALDQHWPGHIDRVYPALDQASRNATVAALFPDEAGGQVRPGMAVIMAARLVSQDDALTAPIQAIHGEPGASHVFVLDGVHALRRRVELGASQDGRVHITAGLSAGDELIVTPDPRLRDGQRVWPQVQDPAS